MRDRHDDFQQRNAQIIAIAPDTLENAKGYFESNELPFICLPDPDREVYRKYDVKSTMVSLGQRPALFVIDGDGIVRFAYIGWQQWEIPEIDDTLQELDRLSS